MPDKRAKLIHEWEHDKDRYRLLARGKWSVGYEDEYIIEKLGQDGIGEPRWDGVANWKPDDRQDTLDLLVSALKSVIKPSP